MTCQFVQLQKQFPVEFKYYVLKQFNATYDNMCFNLSCFFFYLFNGATREDGCLSLDYGSPTGTLYAPGRRFEAKIRKLRVFLAKARNKEITQDMGGGN